MGFSYERVNDTLLGSPGWDMLLSTNVTRFERAVLSSGVPTGREIGGDRSVAVAQIARRWQAPGWYVTPKARVHMARYSNDNTGREQLPLFAQARYSIIPGAWHAEATAGQFMNGDRGFKLASVHWAGDTRVALQYQKTGDTRQPNMPTRSFAGINISLPFGPKAAAACATARFG